MIGIFFTGIASGLILNWIIRLISKKISQQQSENDMLELYVPITAGMMFSISYTKTGINLTFIKAAIFDCMLIIISIVDLKYRKIPNYLTAATALAGLLFLPSGVIPIKSALLGLLAGGGILFLLAMVPGAIGGGDIKMMSALGLFLGLIPTIGAIVLAFIISVPVNIFLVVSKIKGRKDYIPFGPFLALGSFIAYHYFL